LEHCLTVASETFDKIEGQTPAWKRAEMLRAVASKIKERKEELAMLIATEGGKPLKDAMVEATRSAITLEECASAALKMEGREWGMQRAPGTEHKMAFTIREPIGVVLAISAFNHPLNLACHQIGTALAAGNTVIMKPGNSTPLSSIILAEIFSECGLPEGVLQVVLTSNENAGVLVSSPKIDFLTFIGSARVGWMLRRNIADGTRMAAEHGGNAASIVLADADLDRALPLIVRGSYYHAGQVCVSTQRLYVERSIEAEFTERLIELAKKLKCGDAREADVEVGPLIEPREVTRVDNWVQEAIKGGAELLLGGKPITDTVYATTVLRNASEDSKVIKEEVFGPVATVQPVDSLDEAIAKVNASDNPFQSSIFTQDIDMALSAAKRIHANAFMINDLTAFRVDWMPFGGRKVAGLGMGGTEHSVMEMSEEKLIVFNPKV
jgi:acyl-CoA reductase-like NAD-dependent aldehyde dehydrogenase